MNYPPIDPALREPAYPLQNHLGFELVSWCENFAALTMPLREVHMNRYGIPHGGLYATLLDTVMGYAGAYTGDPANRRLAMTLSLTTNFLSRPTDEVLFADAKTIGGGRRTFFAEGAVRDGAGTLLATGSGTFRYRG